MSASMDRPQWLRFAFSLAVCIILNYVIGTLSVQTEDFFLCRNCGHEIFRITDITNVPSKTALRQRNDTFANKRGVLIQLFKNPHNKQFEVITTTRADLQSLPEAISEDTWFQGYSWKICGCPNCGRHLGWEYLPFDSTAKSKQSFFGLILENLLYQNEVDSLLLVPKSYTS